MKSTLATSLENLQSQQQAIVQAVLHPRQFEAVNRHLTDLSKRLEKLEKSVDNLAKSGGIQTSDASAEAKADYDVKNRLPKEDLGELRQFLEDGLNSNLLPQHKDFLNLAIAHLYFMDYDPAKARQYLTAVQGTKNKKLLTQMHIENILLTPQDRDISLENVDYFLKERWNHLERLNGFS